MAGESSTLKTISMLSRAGAHTCPPYPGQSVSSSPRPTCLSVIQAVTGWQTLSCARNTFRQRKPTWETSLPWQRRLGRQPRNSRNTGIESGKVDAGTNFSRVPTSSEVPTGPARPAPQRDSARTSPPKAEVPSNMKDVLGDQKFRSACPRQVARTPRLPAFPATSWELAN